MQPEIDGTPEQKLQVIEDAAGTAREEIEQQRERELRAAESAAQRSEIDSRFDSLQADVDSKVSAAIESVKSEFSSRFDSLEQTINSRLVAPNAGDTGEDDGIISIEEITDDIGSGVQDALRPAGQVAEQVAEEVDKAPERVHGLFKRWWG